MDERVLQEFESLFEASVRPSVKIQPVTWSRLVVALDGSERAAAGVAVAIVLARRLQVPLHFLATRALLEGEEEVALSASLERWQQEAVDEARAAGVESSGASQLGSTGEAILEELQRMETSLLVIPTPHGGQSPDSNSLGSTVDHLLEVSDCPTLLIKAPLEQPEQVFQRLLAYVPGGFEVGPHFSLPFSLVAEEGSLELMHVVNREEVHRCAAAFEVTPDGDTEVEQAASMTRALEEKMTALLEAAVREVRNEPFRCRSVVCEGQPIEEVASRLVDTGASLLIVESESRPETSVPLEAYAILKEIGGVPILAL